MATIEITLEQLRNAILGLPDAQRRELLDEVERAPASDVKLTGERKPHSTLDIPPVRLGGMLRPLSGEDDLLGEMLENRA